VATTALVADVMAVIDWDATRQTRLAINSRMLTTLNPGCRFATIAPQAQAAIAAFHPRAFLLS
jgi:hypothetical protein